MRIRMEKPGHRAAPDEVKDLEETLGRALPSDYADFLLMQNGGRPDPSRLAVPRHPAGHCEIKSFYGLGGEIPCQTLWWGLEAHRDSMPDGFLPIAFTDQGHEICLVMREENFGAVVLWDQEWECGKDCWDNVYDIAGSFIDFLAILASGGPPAVSDGESELGADAEVRKLH